MVSRVSSGRLWGAEKSVAVPEADSIKAKISALEGYNYDLSPVSEARTTELKTGKQGVLRTKRTLYAHQVSGWKPTTDAAHNVEVKVLVYGETQHLRPIV
jgi:hypothetical protein